MKRFAAKTGETEKMVQNMTVQVKESDIEAGRTLKDIHGNLVRVDQRLIRPDSRTLQFINLVKRPVYNYRQHGAPFTVGKNYSTGARLDSLQARIEFNMNLPHNLADWPGFFSSNEDSIYAVRSSLVMANHKPGSIFVIATLQKSESVNDDLNDDLGVIPDIDVGLVTPGAENEPVIFTGIVSGMSELNKLATGDVKGQNGGTTDIAGLNWAIEDPRWDKRDYYDLSRDPYLASWEATPFCIGGDCTTDPNDRIWIAMESYAINNNGGIRTVKDFTDTTSDPFSLLKDSAGEIIWYVKNDITTTWVKDTFNQVNPTDKYGVRNIDLVIIPDLALAALQRMISVLEEIGD